MNPEGHDPNLLAAFLEDRLDERERTRLLGHLAECSECRGTLALIGRAAAAGALPQVAPVPEPPEESRAWRVPGRFWLPIAASVTLAVAVVFRLLPPTARIEDSPPPRPSASSVVEQPSSPSTPSAHRPEPIPRSIPNARRPISPSVVDESLLVKRGGERRIAGKAFRLSGGVWVDVDFDPKAASPVVNVVGSQERAAMLARLPALAPYAGLGERVVVVFEGTVYRFSP